MKRTFVLAAVAALSLFLVACGGGGGGGGNSIEAWCAVGEDFAGTSALESADPTDPEAFRAALEEFEAQLDEVRAAAPDEIRDDVALVLDGFDELFAALEAVDFDMMQVDLSVVEAFNSEEFTAAGERVGAFTDENCSGLGS